MELWQQTARDLSYRLMSRYSFVLARMSKEHYRQDLELFLEPFLEELEKAAREDQGKMDSSWEDDECHCGIEEIPQIREELEKLSARLSSLEEELDDLDSRHD